MMVNKLTNFIFLSELRL